MFNVFVLSDSLAIVGAKVNTAKSIPKDKTPITTTDEVSDISTRTEDMPSSSVLVIIPVCSLQSSSIPAITSVSSLPSSSVSLITLASSLSSSSASIIPPVFSITTRTEDDCNITGTDDCDITGMEYDCGITVTDDGTDKLEDNNANSIVVPFPLTELYDLKYCTLSQKSLEEKLKNCLLTLESLSQCREMESATREQRKLH